MVPGALEANHRRQRQLVQWKLFFSASLSHFSRWFQLVLLACLSFSPWCSSSVTTTFSLPVRAPDVLSVETTPPPLNLRLVQLGLQLQEEQCRAESGKQELKACKTLKAQVKSIEDTCYAEAYLPVDARDCFRNSLDKHCNFICKEDKDCMCDLFKDHLSRIGYRSPDTLIGIMFKYMHETHVVCGANDLPAEVESFAATVPPAGDDNGDDGVRSDFATTMPSLGHGIVREEVLDGGAPAGPSNTVVKEVVVVAGIDDIVGDVEPKNGSRTKTHEEEASVTEKMDLDGLYDAPTLSFLLILRQLRFFVAITHLLMILKVLYFLALN